MSNHNGAASPAPKHPSSKKEVDSTVSAGEETKFAPVQDFIKSLMAAHRYVNNRRSAASNH